MNNSAQHAPKFFRIYDPQETFIFPYNSVAKTRNRICKRIYISARRGVYIAEIFRNRANIRRLMSATLCTISSLLEYAMQIRPRLELAGIRGYIYTNIPNNRREAQNKM